MSKEVELMAAYLASRSEIKGKKAFQKLAYLAKCIGYPLKAEYRMYLYGPFSQEVAAELDQILARDILRTDDNGISMKEGSLSHHIIQENGELLRKYSSILHNLSELFGNKSPKQLELLVTAHFVSQTLKDHYGITDRDEVIEAIVKAKHPKFSREEIESAYSEIHVLLGQTDTKIN